MYDFGGGTFDVSVLEIGDDVIEVKSTDGYSHLFPPMRVGSAPRNVFSTQRVYSLYHGKFFFAGKKSISKVFAI